MQGCTNYTTFSRPLVRADLERQQHVFHTGAVIRARDLEERALISTISESVVVQDPPLTTLQGGIPTGEMGSRVHSTDGVDHEGLLPSPNKSSSQNKAAVIPQLGTAPYW
jgi:hypothetical protein